MLESSDEYLESLEVELLLTAIMHRYGYDFRNYVRSSLRRRIRRAAQKEGVADISELQGRILHDPECMRRFVANVAVGTTSMFRDASFYLSLRRKVIPLLRTYPFIRIWHVGCSTGEEVYSMAILLEEEGIYDRCRIYATDLCDDLLDRARAGAYLLDKVQCHAIGYRRAGGTAELSAYYAVNRDNAVFREDLRRNVVFAQHNLVSDGSFNEFNVILCRNVLIYFDRALRDRVHKLFCDSLGMFGVLGLGIRETLRDMPYEDHYCAVDENARLYRRIR